MLHAREEAGDVRTDLCVHNIVAYVKQDARHGSFGGTFVFTNLESMVKHLVPSLDNVAGPGSSEVKDMDVCGLVHTTTAYLRTMVAFQLGDQMVFGIP